jgi:hypothetical protein
MCDAAVSVVAVVNSLLPSGHVIVRSARRYAYTLSLLVLNQSMPAEQKDPLTSKVGKLLEFLESCSSDSLVMMVDAFDTCFVQHSSIAIERFRSFRSQIVWAAEQWYSDQQQHHKKVWDRLASASPAPDSSSSWRSHRYLNTGAVIGYAGALRSLARAALNARPLRQSLCGNPHGSRCSDQWLYGHILATDWTKWRASLDYESELFFTASGDSWSLARAKQQIHLRKPCIVHMPFQQSPLIKATWQALTSELLDSYPWPEADPATCVERHRTCFYAKRALSHLLFNLEHHTHSDAIEMQQTDEDHRQQLCLPMSVVQCSSKDPCCATAASHGELFPHPAVGTKQACVPREDPCNPQSQEFIARQLASSCSAPDGTTMWFAGSFKDLCGQNASMAFWELLAKAVQAKPIQRPEGGRISNISKLSWKALTQEANYLLIHVDRRFARATRAYWASFPTCSADMPGKGRVIC